MLLSAISTFAKTFQPAQIVKYGRASISSSACIASTSSILQNNEIHKLSIDFAQRCQLHTTPQLGITLKRMHQRGGPPWHRTNPSSKSFIAGHPTMKGVVLRVLIKNPKKPNSGNRKCVLVRLENGKEKIAYVPGEGHNLQEHSQVLCNGGRKKDLIGVRLRVIRGKLDCAPVQKKVV